MAIKESMNTFDSIKIKNFVFIEIHFKAERSVFVTDVIDNN